jgi:hypothetical protein
MLHVLRFVNTYQPDVMLAYKGPHAADPHLGAAVQQEVSNLQAVLKSARIPGLNLVGNVITFKHTQLQVLVSSE